MDQWQELAPLLEDPERFGAVLDADGAVVHLNEYAESHLGVSVDDVEGKRFWALPWRSSSPVDRRLQTTIQNAADGSYTSVELAVETRSEHTPFEFRFRPIRDRGTVSHLLVEGREMDERERLAEELQRSEELHRVTLNNMTDTVLITNDEGEFTYVCPNVHFIFGYTAEEIYEFGTITELLGSDLDERVDLGASSVQTNIECTATDKSGEEHTLLVNVRQVSIQGGTKLYSCRDVTKRKQREVALSQLQSTSRELLYTETCPEVATQITTDAEEILPTGAVAVYRLDDDENVLYPVAASDTIDRSYGPLPEVSLEQAGSIATAFVEETTRLNTDGSDPFTGTANTGGIGANIAVPLGDHGVLLVTTDTDTDFGTLDREIAELLAATTEAAFDRIARENALRERDTRLQEKNRQLSEVNRISDIIREIDQELVHAESREAIEAAVCTRLTAEDRFSFAWIGSTSASHRSLTPRAWEGDEDGYLDAISLTMTDESGTVEPSVRTAQSRSPVLVENTASELRDAAWCRAAVSRNFHSALTIPLVYDEVLIGTLGVYADAPNAFGEMVEEVLVELGDTIAAAINSVQRKEALRSDSVTELDYRITGSQSLLQRIADTHSCTVELEGAVPTSADVTLLFVHISGTDISAVCESAADFVDVAACDVIRGGGESGLVKVELRGEFVSGPLSDHGATLRQFTVTPDRFEIGVDVPKSVPPHSIDELISNLYGDVELVAQRENTRSPERSVSPDDVRDRLTARQREVLEVAYHSGFFAPKRELNGADIATMLDISSTAFYDHIRRAERKLIGSLFESTI